MRDELAKAVRNDIENDLRKVSAIAAIIAMAFGLLLFLLVWTAR